ncbi:MAG TPA: hypothetical protein VKE50_04990 [Thermoanaerobaculia bacterium]|nr:hypothetical protein [Thermoanaerobaculia bacterium]
MLLYVLIKLAAETAWCVAGLTRLRDDRLAPPLTSALTPALARLLLARLAAFLAAAIIPPVPDWFRYFAVLLPLRWLAWGFAGQLIAGFPLRAQPILIGDRRSRLWRGGGLVVSSLADLPAFLSGVWVGEFWP